MQVKIGVILVLALATANAFAAKVLGKLGQTVEAVSIYRKMSAHSHVLYHAGQYKYLVINDTRNGSWYAVTMVDGSLGYVASEKVAVLPYNVTTAGPAASASQPSAAETTPGAGMHLPAVGAGTNGDGASRKVEMLNVSYQYIGTPYRYGGENIKTGIDCSAFVKQMFGKIGVDLPRTAAEQAKVGTPITRYEDMKPGDRLYFWDRRHGKVGHTGIFLGYFKDGGAYFIHSSSNNHGIATNDLRDAKWQHMLVAVRRDTQVN